MVPAVKGNEGEYYNSALGLCGCDLLKWCVYKDTSDICEEQVVGKPQKNAL